MSIFTSVWFWLLVLGIILTIVGVVIWIVTGQANLVPGLLLGAGVAFIISGLLMWIFGRPKTPPPEVKQASPIAAGQQLPPYYYGSTMPTTGLPSATVTTQASQMPPSTATVTTQATIPQQQVPLSQQQQLLQLLQSNPQLLNAYAGTTVPPKI